MTQQRIYSQSMTRTKIIWKFTSLFYRHNSPYPLITLFRAKSSMLVSLQVATIILSQVLLLMIYIMWLGGQSKFNISKTGHQVFKIVEQLLNII